MCYRRATSVLKNHPEEHRALCLMADSEGPAECAAAGECRSFFWPRHRHRFV
jgi:hypothetical protein